MLYCYATLEVLDQCSCRICFCIRFKILRVPPLIIRHFSVTSSPSSSSPSSSSTNAKVKRESKQRSMEFLLELLLTAVLSLVLAYLFAKLISMASRGDSEEEYSVSRSERVRGEMDESDGEVVKEESIFGDELRNRGLGIERRVAFVGEAVKVDKFRGESASGGSVMAREGEGVLKEVWGKASAIGVKEEGEEERQEISPVIGLQEQSIEEVSVKEVKACESLGDGGLEEKLVEDGQENVEIREVGLKLVEKEQVIAKDAKDDQIEVCENSEDKGRENGAKKRGEVREKEGLLGDDDDWEGIERSGVEKRFDAAAKFVGSGDNNDRLSKLGSDLQMQLYGLHKVAIEGPCYKPAPLALMVSARAKWNAWQKLGNMSPEVAMEQYITILSEGIPGWGGQKSDRDCDQDKTNDSPDAGESGTETHCNHPRSENERIIEAQSTCEGVDALEGTKNL